MSRYAWLLIVATGTGLLRPVSRPVVSAPLVWGPQRVLLPSLDTVSVDTTTLTVPLFHGRPDGRTVRIPVIRLRALRDMSRPPIVYLAGGPGASGIGALTQLDMLGVILRLRTERDVILFDQRGTGASQPTGLSAPFRAPVPDNSSARSDTANIVLAVQARRMADSLRATGLALEAFNTRENADDVDSLRRAIGASRIALWGHSYGSHLGLAVLQRHGAFVERVIFGGINGLDQRRRHPRDGDRWLARVDSVVRLSPLLAQQVPNLVAMVDAGLRALDATPRMVSAGAQSIWLTGDDVRLYIVNEASNHDLTRRLPIYASALASGDLSTLVPVVGPAIRQRVWRPIIPVMDLPSGVSAERMARIQAETSSAILRSAINWPFDIPSYRAAWNVPDLGDPFRVQQPSDVPALLFSGSLDGRVSLEDAREVRRGFRRGAHVIVQNAGHNLYTESPAIAVTMEAFLAGRAVRDTSIIAQVELRSPSEAADVALLQRVLTRGDGAAAADTLSALAERTHVTSFTSRGVLLGLLRDPARAGDALPLAERAAVLAPNIGTTWTRLGDAHRAVRNRAAALTAYDRALAINPFDVEALRGRRLAVAMP